MEITIKVTSIEELRQMAEQVLAGHPGQQDTYQKVKGSEPVGTVDTPAEYNPEPKAQEPKAQEPKEAPKPAAAPAPKVLSRLEQLRMEASGTKK